jgi:hypothetical protein
MPVREFRSIIATQLAFNANITTNTTTNGFIIDVKPYNDGIKFVPACVAFTDGTYNFTLEESDASNMSGSDLIDPSEIDGLLSGLTKTAADTLGVILANVAILATKRYVRINVVSTGVTTGARIVVFAEEWADQKPPVGIPTSST